MIKKSRILQIANLWRCIPAYFLVFTISSDVRNLITDELYYWKKCAQRLENTKFDLFCGLMLDLKEYRSLLQYRISVWGGIRKIILKVLFPGMETLYINTPEIGPRLFIQHGFATNISALKIGSDCWINQQVTIGYTFDKKPPTIGNGVRISAGAKVIGDIKIEDNVIIAANAAVVKDIEENDIVGGVPAKKIGVNIEHKLYVNTKNKEEIL